MTKAAYRVYLERSMEIPFIKGKKAVTEIDGNDLLFCKDDSTYSFKVDHIHIVIKREDVKLIVEFPR